MRYSLEEEEIAESTLSNEAVVQHYLEYNGMNKVSFFVGGVTIGFFLLLLKAGTNTDIAVLGVFNLINLGMMYWTKRNADRHFSEIRDRWFWQIVNNNSDDDNDNENENSPAPTQGFRNVGYP